MSAFDPLVNDVRAPIKNVARCLSLVRTMQARHMNLQNFGVFAGLSGYGKSMASAFAQGVTNAILIEMSDTWTKKDLLQKILHELGRPNFKGRLSQMDDEITNAFARDPNRPLIIDEADKLMDKNMFEMMRMIMKRSKAPCILIGEDTLPLKLERIDRFRDLVLHWEYAQPCDLEDTHSLARAYYPKLQISDDLLDHAREEAKGRARQVVSTIHAIANMANNLGVSQIGLQQYRDQDGYFASNTVPRRDDRRAA